MKDSLVSLINNAALLLALGVLYDTLNLDPKLKSRWVKVLTGFFIGIIGITVMLTPWQFTPGVTFDTRSVLLSVTGLFFGFVTTTVAAVMASLFRFYQGGAGAWTGTGVIITSSVLGLAWRYHRHRWQNIPDWLELYALGIVVHIAMLLWMLTLPGDISRNVLDAITLPVMTIYPVGTVLLGKLLLLQQARRRAQETVQENEERFRKIIETTKSGYFFIDREGRYQQVNAAWLRMHKYDSPDEVIGKHFAITQVESFLPQAQKNVEGLFKGETLPHGEASRRCKDGSIGYHSFSLNTVVKDGKIIGLEGFLIDMTGHKQAQEALRESEEKYRALVENSTDVVMRFDHEGRHLFVSQSVERIVEFPAAHFIGKTHSELGFPEEQCQFWESHIRSVFDRGEIIATEFEYVGTQGTITFDWRLIPEFDSQGSVHSVLSVSRDITQRKQAETALQESNERFRLAFQTSPDSININRLQDGMYIDVNNGFTEIMGYSREEAIGKTSLELNTWNNPQDRARLVEQLREQGYCENLEAEFRSKYGEVKIGLMSARVITLGESPHILSITRDITEHRHLEAESKKAELLQIELEKEKELVTLKENILSIMSHEFRTPLTIIQTSSDLLSRYFDRMTEERRTQSLQQIGQQVASLTRMIDDILAVGRAQSGRIEFNPSKIDLEAFCRTVVDQIRFADDLEHEFKLTNHATDLQVMADASLLRHIIGNLLTNAVKYSPERSHIMVELDIRDSYALIQVNDEGMGIPEEDQPRLFDPFHRASNVGSIKGTGLGLSIVRQYVELHGGHIELESTGMPGEGASFSVWLPL